MDEIPHPAGRVERERLHASILLETDAISRPWSTAAGVIRKKRRIEFLTSGYSDLPERPRVLEVGCGTGIFTEEISRVFDDLTSIDVADTLLAVARERLPHVRIENADIHHTPYPSATFDVVIGRSILHHLNWDAALCEIARILKPGAQVRFCEPNLSNPQIFLQKNWPWLKHRLGDSPDEYAFTPGQIARSLESAGFVNIVAQPFEFLHPSTPDSWIAAVLRVEALLERTPLAAIGGSIKIAAFKPSTAPAV